MGNGAATRAAPSGVDDVERLLQELRQTPAGVLIYDQLTQLLGEWRTVRWALRWRVGQSVVTQGYAALLVLLLDEFARDASNENVLRVCARLISIRRAFPNWITVQGSALVSLKPVGDDARAMEVTLHEALARLVKCLKGAPPAEPLPSPTSRPGVTGEEARLPVSRAVAEPAHEEEGVDLQPLHRAGDQLNGMQKALSQKVREAIERNKKLEESLQAVRSALYRVAGIDDVNELKQALTGNVAELVRRHRHLVEDLETASDYLRGVETESKRLDSELHKVRALSLTDELTGLPNRRAFDRRLEEEMSRAQRDGAPLALATLDLDRFKAINDAHGHPAGDAVLRCYAKQILSGFRNYDMVARYGGEEFSVLLPNTDAKRALNALQKVHKRVAAIKCEYGGALRPLPTFSAGLTLYVRGESLARFVSRADKLLYRAKELGRNRIEANAVPAEEVSA